MAPCACDHRTVTVIRRLAGYQAVDLASAKQLNELTRGLSLSSQEIPVEDIDSIRHDIFNLWGPDGYK